MQSSRYCTDVFVVSTNDAFSRSSAMAFVNSAGQYGIRVTDYPPFPLGATVQTIEQSIIGLRNRSAHVIMLSMHQADATNFYLVRSCEIQESSCRVGCVQSKVLWKVRIVRLSRRFER